ncbi:chemokine (C-C motif) ligand 34b, duplicate 4 [Hoplias malabaricus]|uniref:chemokine (C-C motif) ligand 34b, duplicate 4 n=1 Tax=Hoplias malabaricus TaxID=27720 RepID=UPI003462600F
MFRWNTMLFALAASFILFGCITGISANFRRPTKVGLVCCEAVSRAPIPQKMTLVGYKHQNALAPCVEAIIFFTDKLEKICSDPTARWIPRRISGLEEYKD